jgi:hypothetical protein
MDWIYCGTNPPVDEFGTQRLLAQQQAIWCPPPWRELPEENDRIWLVWRDTEQTSGILVLGAGRVLAPQPSRCRTTPILWTNRNRPGLTISARQQGYDGPTSMRFLCLEPATVRLTRDGGIPPVRALPGIGSRFNEANLEQLGILQQTLPID